MTEKTVRRLVVTVHGIRTYGQWQERLEALVSSAPEGSSVDFFNYKYGYFSVIAFIVPIFRWLVVRRFRLELIKIATEVNYDRIDLVGHSFGTHVVAWSLTGRGGHRVPAIDTIILAGSVLRSGFPWRDLLGKRVRRVINDCGSRDSVLLLSQFLVLFTGMAGRTGFSGATGATFRNRYTEFGHSGYFEDSIGQPSDDYMSRNWLPLLVGPQVSAPLFDHRKPRPLDGFVTFLGNNAEPIKLLVYLAPILLFTSWIYALYISAETERANAENARKAERDLRVIADQNRDEAERARDSAQRALRSSQIQESRRLANLAKQQTAKSDYGTALALSIKALQANDPSRPYIAEAELQLYRAITQLREKFVFEHADYGIRSIESTSDQRQVLVAGGDLTLVDIATGHKRSLSKQNQNIYLAKLLDPKLALAIRQNGDASILDIVSGVERKLDGERIFLRLQPQICAAKFLMLTPELDRFRLWTIDGKQLISFPTNDTAAAAFSSDCSQLYVASTDKSSTSYIDVWEANPPRLIKRIPINGSRIFLQSNPTMPGFISAVSSSELLLTTDISHPFGITFKGHTERVSAIAISSDGSRVAAGADDGSVLVWNAKTATRELTLAGHEGRITDIKFSEDKRWIVTSSNDATARIWDSSSGKLVSVFRGHSNDVVEVQFIGQDHIATRSRDSTIRLWSIKPFIPRSVCTSTRATKVLGMSADRSKIVMSPDSFLTDPTELKLIDKSGKLFPTTSKSLASLPSLRAAAVSNDGELLAIALVDNTVRIYSVPSATELVAIPHKKGVHSLRFAGSERLISGSHDGFIRVWNSKSGKLITEIDAKITSLGTLVLSANGKLVTSSGGFGKIARLWQLETGTSIQSFADEKSASIAAISDDGELVATGGINAIIWDASTGTQLRTVKTNSFLRFLLFSPDRTRLLTSGPSDHPQLWNVSDGSFRELVGSSSEATDATFSSSGDRVTIVYSDGSMRIWSTASAEMVGEFDLNRSKALSVSSLEADDQVLVTSSNGCVSTLPFLRTGQLLDLAKSSLQRALTSDQGKEFFIDPN